MCNKQDNYIPVKEIMVSVQFYHCFVNPRSRGYICFNNMSQIETG